MKLRPGLYKLREKNSFDPQCVYLHVWEVDKNLYYTVNGSAGSPADEYNDIPMYGYELVKQLKLPAVSKATVVLNWTDPDGDTYSKKFSSVQEMRKFFNEYPQLAKAIGSKKYWIIELLVVVEQIQLSVFCLL